jgi:ribosome maturation factor RimP
VGRDVKVKTRTEIEGERIHRGVITRAGDADFTITTDAGERTIPFDAVASAQTVFVWAKPARPSAPKH